LLLVLPFSLENKPFYLLHKLSINNRINTLLLWLFIRDSIKFLPKKFQYAKQEFEKVFKFFLNSM
jgi:hypothetical protein